MKRILCFLLCITVTLESIWCMPESQLQSEDAKPTVQGTAVRAYRDLVQSRTLKKGKAPKVKKAKKAKKAKKKKASKKTKKTKISKEEQARLDAKQEAMLNGPKPNTYVEEFGFASSSLSVENPCGNEGVMDEGQLHMGKLGYDSLCLVQLQGRDDVYTERCSKATGNRQHWFSCNNGQFVNKGSNQCLTYRDNYTYDDVVVKNCDSNSKGQQFDKLDIKKRKVASNSFDGKASVRTEFRLKARSGSGHCLSGCDAWVDACYVGADYCHTSPKFRFFFKDESKSRFDYWSEKEGRDFTFPDLYEEARDGIIASSIMYGLSAIRYNLRKNRKYKDDVSGEDISSDILDDLFFKDSERPSTEQVKVTLQEIYDVPTDWDKRLKNWLGIWSKDQRENTSLYYFSDTIPKDSRLSFGVFVEKLNKRVSVWIKGSEEFEHERDEYFNDWSGKNAKCGFTDKDGYNLDTRRSGVQNGYSNVVNANYFKIVSELQKLFSEGTYDDYKVYVVGHSMGGATSTLLGYKLALGLYQNEISGIPMPISIVSVASPQVGDSRFMKNFNILEREGVLRHLRIENQEDWAPKTTGGSEPSLGGGLRSCTVDVFDEAQYVGIDLHLQYLDSYIDFTPKYAEIKYEDVQSRRLRPVNNATKRLLKPAKLPAPYDFIDTSKLDSNGYIEPGFFHSRDAHMALLYIDFKDKGYNLNIVYEDYLA